MGREAGGGIGMGNTCKSMADSCQCMAKTLQYCKVISLQLIKINEKKIIIFVLHIIFEEQSLKKYLFSIHHLLGIVSTGFNSLRHISEQN